MDDELKELVFYRFQRALETLEVAKELLEKERYKDANNRSYYAAYYAMRAVYAVEGRDFKKHKTLIASFNKEYVATGIFPREIGRKISLLQIIREQSDYSDFYVASKEESQLQVEFAEQLVALVRVYLSGKEFLK